jgi:hypothetical protein
MRDMSEKQFQDALRRHGMKNAGFMGYVEMGIEGHRLSVCRYNAGNNRRAQLAYLLRKQQEEEERIEALTQVTPKLTSGPIVDAAAKERNAAKMREVSSTLNQFFFGTRR